MQSTNLPIRTLYHSFSLPSHLTAHNFAFWLRREAEARNALASPAFPQQHPLVWLPCLPHILPVESPLQMAPGMHFYPAGAPATEGPCSVKSLSEQGGAFNAQAFHFVTEDFIELLHHEACSALRSPYCSRLMNLLNRHNHTWKRAMQKDETCCCKEENSPEGLEDNTKSSPLLSHPLSMHPRFSQGKACHICFPQQHGMVLGTEQHSWDRLWWWQRVAKTSWGIKPCKFTSTGGLIGSWCSTQAQCSSSFVLGHCSGHAGRQIRCKDVV